MLSLKQLQEWIEEIEEITADVAVSLTILEKEKDIGTNGIIGGKEDTFQDHINRQLMFTATVQLCKLFVNSDIERRNLRKLFNRLTYEPYHNYLKRQLRQNRGKKGKASTKKDLIRKISPFVQQIIDRKELILKLKTLRDRKYVHADPARELPKVTLSELEELLSLSQKVVVKIKEIVCYTEGHRESQ